MRYESEGTKFPAMACGYTLVWQTLGDYHTKISYTAGIFLVKFGLEFGILRAGSRMNNIK